MPGGARVLASGDTTFLLILQRFPKRSCNSKAQLDGATAERSFRGF